MTIGSLDSLIAGLLPPRHVFKAPVTVEAAGTAHSTVYQAGNPGAIAIPTGIDGTALTSLSGAVPFPAAVSGESIYLAGLHGRAENIGMIFLLDRLWHNGSISSTTTTAQAISHPGIPPRDVSGSTDGVGIQCAIEVSSATGNGSAITNMTISYTDESGNAGNTGVMEEFPATAAAGTFIPFELAAGDTGVRSVESLTLGTSLVSGTVHLVQYRLIACLAFGSDTSGSNMSAIDLGMPKMHDNTVPFYAVLPTATGLGGLTILMNYAQG